MCPSERKQETPTAATPESDRTPDRESSDRDRASPPELDAQYVIGNRATQRLLRDAVGGTGDSDGRVDSEAARLSRFLGPSATSADRPRVQAKLTRNVSGDRFERQADSVADRVLNRDPTTSPTGLTAEDVAPKRWTGRGVDVGDDIATRLSRRRESGRPLSRPARAFFESQFDHDFSRVRVHADAEATQMAESVGARAFTHGRDIYLRGEEYRPHSLEGRRLLAHELTHVVQQSALPRGTRPDVQRSDGPTDEEASAPRARDITVRWRDSVVLSLFQFFRPLVASLSDEEMVRVIEAWADQTRFHLTYTDDRSGDVVRHTNLTRSRTEQLARDHDVETLRLESHDADQLLSRFGLTWSQFEHLNAPEIRGIFESLASFREHASASPAIPDSLLPARPDSDEGPAVEFPPGASEEDRNLLRRFVREVFAGVSPPSSEPDQSQSISMADIEAVRELYEMPEEDRTAVLDMLRPSERSPTREEPIRLADLIESVRAARRIEQTADEFGEAPDRADPDDEEPIVHRPVRGRIFTPDGPITTGMEARFTFQLEDAVDAFRVPHVHIEWVAIRREENGRITRIETDTTNYIEVRDEGLLNEKTFEVEFEKAGTYEIHAVVDHNFYLPDAFERSVKVVPPTEVIDDLRARDTETEAFGTVGERSKATKHEFSGLVGDYAMGHRLVGELTEEQFRSGTGGFSDSYAAIDRDIATLTDLVEHYRTAQEAEGQQNQDLIDWATGRIARLRATRRQLESYERGGSHPIALRGYFASQTSGVRHGRLNLVAWFEYLGGDGERGIYVGHLLDHTGLAGPANMHFTAIGDSYETMIEKLFVELSEDYPTGYVSVGFQQYAVPNGESAPEPRRTLVTFERETATLSSDIARIAFSTPVSIVVNTAAAVLTVFPPTTGIGIAVSLAYNAASTGYEIGEAMESDTLRTSHAVDVGLVFLDALPVIGKGVKAVASGTRVATTIDLASGAKAFKVMGHASQFSGEFYVFTAEAIAAIQGIHDEQILKLAAVMTRLQSLERQGAPPEILAIEQRRARQLEQDIRASAVRTLTQLASEQLVSVATPAAVARMTRARTGPHPPEITPETDLDADPPRRLQPGDGEEVPVEGRPRPSHPPATEADSETPHPRAPPVEAPEPGATSLPDRVLSAGRPIQVIQSSQLYGEEVRVRYETDGRGLITRIWIETGPDATRHNLDQHARTIRLMQRYQGLSGAVRVYLTRLQNIIARYVSVVGTQPLPGSRAYEAKQEIEKLPSIVRAQAAKLADPNLTARERADVMAKIDQLEADLQRHIDTFERMDVELGSGYVAARDEPRSNQAALDAGYPPLEDAPGHYYVRSPTGGFHLRRFTWSSDPPKQIVWRDGTPVVEAREGGSEVHEPPETLRPGETRTYTGPRSTTATAERRVHDRAVVIRSVVGPGRGRLGYEKAMFSGVEVGLPGWHRAHSQGQGTGHESSFGILYAPEEVNLQYQNAGIEQQIRDLFATIDPDVTLHLTTETVAHEGTRRLESITYKIEAQRGDGPVTRLYEVEITVEDARDSPRVGVTATEHADVERFLPGEAGRPPGTEPPETDVLVDRPNGPPHFDERARGAYDAVTRMLSVLEQRPDLAVYREELMSARERLYSNPSPETVENIYDTLEQIERLRDE